MANDDWPRVKALFGEAVERPLPERTAFLDEACRGDERLRARVEGLLNADSTLGGFLEQPVVAREGEAAPDRFIGPYRLRRVLSSGGMGVVHEAVQEKPSRRVAVKVMKEGFASREALRRFEYESEILARLDHPNIAKVIEAGTHRREGSLQGEGVPYIVMEYVEAARPITAYVREEALSPRERIALFLQVCDAVHHGHQKGVIHRDLKPSNILVDGQGRVKVIDFGVARAAGRNAAETLQRTEKGQLIGTLRYMSPEQCKADPDDLDTRSDVYSLGLVLYEMLLDARPYDVDETTIYEAVRIIREEPPRRPGALDRALRGDVETILLKALEKDPRSRYPSVADLAADLSRHLKGEVILARPAGAATRLYKWMRRNPVPSSALLFAAASLLVFAGYAVFWYNPRIRAERDKAEAINRFLVEMIEAPDPTAEGIDVKVVDVLDRAAARIALSFGNRPDLKADLQATLGGTYQALGQYASAERQYASALAISTALRGAAHPETLFMRIRRAAAIRDQSRYDEAKAELEELLPLCRSSLGPEHPFTIDALECLASVCFFRKESAEAVRLYRENLEIVRRVYPPEDRHTLHTLNLLANALRDQGELDEAERILAQVLETRRRVLGPEHPDTLLSMGSMANLLGHRRRHKEAEALHRELLDIQSRVMGSEHPYTLATRNNLAMALIEAGRYAEAETMGRELVEIERRVKGDRHKSYLSALENLAVALKNQGKIEEAEGCLREVLEKRRDLLGEENALTVSTMHLLALILKSKGLYEEAEGLNRRVLEARRRLHGSDHASTLLSMNNLANVLGRLERLEEAEALHREALEGRRRVLGAESPDTLDSMYNLANLWKRMGREEEAEALSRESLALRIKGQGEDHPHTLVTREMLARILEGRGDDAGAEEQYRILWQKKKDRYGAEHTSALDAGARLGGTLIRLGRLEEAEALLLEVAEILERTRSEPDEITRSAHGLLAELYAAWGREEEAARWRARIGEPKAP